MKQSYENNSASNLQGKPIQTISNFFKEEKEDCGEEGDFILTPDDWVMRESESSTPAIEHASKLASPA